MVEALETFGGKICLIQDTGTPADYRGDKMARGKELDKEAAVGLIEIPIPALSLLMILREGEGKVVAGVADAIGNMPKVTVWSFWAVTF